MPVLTTEQPDNFMLCDPSGKPVAHASEMHILQYDFGYIISQWHEINRRRHQWPVMVAGKKIGYMTLTANRETKFYRS